MNPMKTWEVLLYPSFILKNHFKKMSLFSNICKVLYDTVPYNTISEMYIFDNWSEICALLMVCNMFAHRQCSCSSNLPVSVLLTFVWKHWQRFDDNPRKTGQRSRHPSRDCCVFSSTFRLLTQRMFYNFLAVWMWYS